MRLEPESWFGMRDPVGDDEHVAGRWRGRLAMRSMAGSLSCWAKQLGLPLEAEGLAAHLLVALDTGLSSSVPLLDPSAWQTFASGW